LLILTGIEVFLAYIQFSVHVMLVLLMGLSLVKAAADHGLLHAFCRFEKRTLVLTLIPSLWLVVASTLSVFFPDSIRPLAHEAPGRLFDTA
jgi:hypothetical protein